jgi:ferredoxin-type protein NapH
MIHWVRDKTKRVSYIRLVVQLLFLGTIYYLSIIAVWKGLLLVLIIGATFFFGRFFCGWICPFGLYMDLVTLFRGRLRIRHWTLPEWLNTNLHRLRYVIAAVIISLVIVPFLTGTASILDIGGFSWLRGPFRPFTILLAPLETLIIPWIPPFGALLEIGGKSISFPYVGEIMSYTGGKSFGLLIAVFYTALVLAGSFKIRRVWCRFCPTGISIAAINRFKQFRRVPILHISKDEEKCTKCGICKRVCPLQVTEVYEKKGGAIKTSMCTLCLRCVEMCPYADCLKVDLVGKTVFRSRNWLES